MKKYYKETKFNKIQSVNKQRIQYGLNYGLRNIIKTYRTNYPCNDELSQLLDELDTFFYKKL